MEIAQINTIPNDVDKRVQDDMRIFKEWYFKQPHLPKDVDETLIYFYVKNAKSLEVAKKKLDAYFTVRGQIPHLLQNWDPTSKVFLDAASGQKVFVLPKQKKEEDTVIWCINLDMTKFDHPQLLIRIVMLADLVIRLYPDSNNMAFVIDSKGFDSSHLSKISVPFVSAVSHWMQEAYPTRPTKFLLINTLPVADFVVNNIFKPFLKKKLAERIIVARDESCLKAHISDDILPSEYGGKGQSVEKLNDYWLKMLVSKKDLLQKICSTVADESKRPKDAYQRADLNFGLDGTFKNLSVD